MIERRIMNKAGMPDPYIELLRGDSDSEAITTYIHSQIEKVRDAYKKEMLILDYKFSKLSILIELFKIYSKNRIFKKSFSSV